MMGVGGKERDVGRVWKSEKGKERCPGSVRGEEGWGVRVEGERGSPIPLTTYTTSITPSSPPSGMYSGLRGVCTFSVIGRGNHRRDGPHRPHPSHVCTDQ